MQLSEIALQRMRGRDISMIVPNPRGELNPLLTVGEQIATVARVHLKLSRRSARHGTRHPAFRADPRSGTANGTHSRMK